MGVDEIAGRPRAGSSSWQSLARGTGAIETDYLNGEIVLLGRLHGVPTPLNAALCAVAGRYARQGGASGRARGRRAAGGGGVSATVDPQIAEPAAEIAERAQTELAQLVDISSPSGDVDGAERVLAVCAALLPPGRAHRASALLDSGLGARPGGHADRHRHRQADAAGPRRHRGRARRPPAVCAPTATGCTAPAPPT